MEKGSYDGRHDALISFVSPKFCPNLYTIYGHPPPCGASAAALITGNAPGIIAKHHGSPHYSDEFMVRYLRRHGCKVIRLTQCLISGGNGVVRRDHVLLLSQLIRKNEGTWCVMYGEACWHNFAMYSVDALGYINKPILSAYIVWHARWQMPGVEIVKTSPKRLSTTV